MTTRSYSNGGDLDHSYRLHYQNVPTAAFYDRAAPYDYFENARVDLRTDYLDRHTNHAQIQEPETNFQNDQPRRRIAVACARCRKRKIKCSGDLGDGSGCSACKASGAEPGQVCTFTRVGSQPIHMRGVEMFAHNASVSGPSQSAAYSIDPQSGVRYAPSMYPSRPRQSIPSHNTRTSYSTDYDTQYETSPTDTYTYASSTIPRQDSCVSACGLENYRSWNNTTGPMSTPATTAFYEPNPAYTFGTLQAPLVPSQHQTDRLPSVTGDSLSPLNMGHLHASLPAQTVHERRLPIPAPHTLQHTQNMYSSAEVPVIRPLTSYTEPRVHINGIHSRNAMAWSSESTTSPARGNSMASFAPPSGLPNISSQCTVSQPVLGYQFSQAVPAPISSSPEVSPTSATTLSDGFTSASSSSPHPMPNSSRNMATSASLYSFSTEATDGQSDTTERPSNSYFTNGDAYSNQIPQSRNSMDHEINAYSDTGTIGSAGGYQAPVSHLRSSVDQDGNAYATNNYQTSIRQPQPQHATSIQALCRPSPYDQSQRQSTANRMSISNFNSHY